MGCGQLQASLQTVSTESMGELGIEWFLLVFLVLTIPTYILGFPCGLAGKESVCNTGDLGSIHGLGRSPGEGKGHPLWYSGLENSMDLYLTAGSDPTLWNPCILPYLKQWVGSLWTSSKIIFQSDLLLLFSC